MANKTRVIEGWTGPGRRDAVIESLKPVDDGLHMVMDERGMYEWWYFDAHLDNGYTLVVFFHASNPNPGLEGKTGMEIVLLRPDGVRVQKFIPYKKSEFSATRDKPEVTIGENTLRVQNREGELPVYEIEVCTSSKHFGQKALFAKRHFFRIIHSPAPANCTGVFALGSVS